MAQILVCELDGQSFIERAEDSIAIAQAARYDRNGKAIPFSGDICPRCGRRMLDARRELNTILLEQAAPLPLELPIAGKPDYGKIDRLEREIYGKPSRLGLPPARDYHDAEGPNMEGE